jgi:hypothetical protein
MTLLREIVGMGLVGPLALGMLGCSLLVGLMIVAFAIVSPLETGGPRLRALVLFEVACLVSTLGLLAALVTARRGTVVAFTTVPAMDPSATAWALANAFSQSEIGLFLVGITLAALGALLALAEAIWLMRAPRGARDDATLRRILHLVVSVLLGAVGLGVLRQMNEVSSLSRHAGSEERFACMDASSAHLATARVHVVLIAVAGTVVLLMAFLAASRRGGAAPSRGAILGAVLTATAGLAGYAATRPLAADARRPMTLSRSMESWCPVTHVDARALPPATACGEASRNLTVEVVEDGIYVDGTRVDLAELPSMLAGKRQYYEGLVVGRHPPPPLVFARADASAAGIVPCLAALRDNYAPEVAAATVLPAAVHSTRTLGDVPRSPSCCAVAIHLGAGAAPIASRATWGEVVAAASLSPRPPAHEGLDTGESSSVPGPP